MVTHICLYVLQSVSSELFGLYNFHSHHSCQAFKSAALSASFLVTATHISGIYLDKSIQFNPGNASCSQSVIDLSLFQHSASQLVLHVQQCAQCPPPPFQQKTANLNFKQETALILETSHSQTHFHLLVCNPQSGFQRYHQTSGTQTLQQASQNATPVSTHSCITTLTKTSCIAAAGNYLWCSF